MLKIIIISVLFITIALIILLTYCALSISSRSDDQARKVHEEKQICSKCKVGKESYELDSLSEACPYIECLEREACPFFKPIEKPEK